MPTTILPCFDRFGLELQLGDVVVVRGSNLPFLSSKSYYQVFEVNNKEIRVQQLGNTGVWDVLDVDDSKGVVKVLSSQEIFETEGKAKVISGTDLLGREVTVGAFVFDLRNQNVEVGRITTVTDKYYVVEKAQGWSNLSLVQDVLVIPGSEELKDVNLSWLESFYGYAG